MGPLPFTSLPATLVIPSTSMRLAAAAEVEPRPVMPVLRPLEEAASLLWLICVGLHPAWLADLGVGVHMYAAWV
jgi:hypothetical protein